MQFHMAYVQFGTTTVMAVNRATMMWFQQFFATKWKRYSGKMMFLIFILPFFANYQVFINDAYYKYDETLDRFALESEYVRKIVNGKLDHWNCFISKSVTRAVVPSIT
uniref:Serpentine receptor class gamma n=1 Tax=Caenorhabditis tropicalis TaxID=1561998 RepID=A0A1I7T644_9PELO